ncbi:uncharacterized protein LOC127239344 isoform X2 [Andrographis paniculata]|nr:uncharacterized protein LOC127239344 isoform X2 [Andrographis paniculata]
MAQLERPRRPLFSDNLSSETPTPSQKTSPTFEQLLKDDEKWLSPMSTSPTFEFSNDPHQQNQYSTSPAGRKSVMARVKERAKKLRYSLSGRKNRLEDEFHNNAIHSMQRHPWPASAVFDHHNIADHDRDRDNDGRSDEEREMDPEYLGAPMYESESAPESLKETARQHPRAVPVISKNHRTPTCTKCKETEQHGNSESPLSRNTSKAQRAISTSDAGKNSGSLTWDKGVSVKEYFMNKLEPGEDERALSQAITEAISPRKSTDQAAGVVDKVKEAVTSLFRHQESSFPTADSPNARISETCHPGSSPQIPVSYNASGGVEDQNQGRILQPN